MAHTDFHSQGSESVYPVGSYFHDLPKNFDNTFKPFK